MEEEFLDGTRTNDEVQDGFVKGLCRTLSGMNAAISRNVISATLQHLLVSNGGSRFKFSHSFGNLLVGQLEATLEGWAIDVRVRTNIYKGDPKYSTVPCTAGNLRRKKMQNGNNASAIVSTGVCYAWRERS